MDKRNSATLDLSDFIVLKFIDKSILIKQISQKHYQLIVIGFGFGNGIKLLRFFLTF